MTKTKLSVLKITLSVVLIVALVAALGLTLVFADEAEPQTRVYDENLDRMLETVGNASEGATAAYYSVAWEAGGCAAPGEKDIYKLASGTIAKGVQMLQLEVRSPDQSIKLKDLKLTVRINDNTPLETISYALDHADISGAVEMATGSDIGADWDTIQISFNQADITVDSKKWDSTAQNAWVGFHLNVADNTKAGKLDIRKVSVVSGGETKVLQDFDQVADIYWDAVKDGVGVHYPAKYDITTSKKIVSTVATSNNVDEAYSAIVLSIAGDSSDVTIAPVGEDGTVGAAKAWAALTDLQGTALPALGAGAKLVVISLESLGNKKIQGVQVSGSGVWVNQAFFTNMEVAVPDKYFPTLDVDSIAYMSKFSFEMPAINGDYDKSVAALAGTDLIFALSYSGSDYVKITDGHAVLGGNASELVNFKIRSRTSNEGRPYLVIKYKLQDGATLDTFRFKGLDSNDAEYGEAWKAHWVAGQLLPSTKDNPYTAEGYEYLIIDIEKTLGGKDLGGLTIYYQSAGTMLIDEIYYADAAKAQATLSDNILTESAKWNGNGAGYQELARYNLDGKAHDGIEIVLSGSAAVEAGESTPAVGAATLAGIRLGFGADVRWFEENDEGVLRDVDGNMMPALTTTAQTYRIDFKQSGLKAENSLVVVHAGAQPNGAVITVESIRYIDYNLDLEHKIVFDDYNAVPSVDGGYWWVDISAEGVSVEEGALKLSVPAGGGVICVGGARPENNHDRHYRYMVIRMKSSDIDMETFRIKWLDDSISYANQGVFVTKSGVPYVLTEEYTDMVIDLVASGIDPEILGFRLYMGGWNATAGTLYIDEIYFADTCSVRPSDVVLPTNDDSKPVITASVSKNEAKVNEEIAITASAVDNYDANVVVSVKVMLNSEEITVTDNKFVPAKAGTYAVTITAKDAANNEATQTLSVVVAEAAQTPGEGEGGNQGGNQGGSQGGTEAGGNQGGNQDNGGLTPGAIAGIVIACVVVAGGAVVAVILIRKKKMSK